MGSHEHWIYSHLFANTCSLRKEGREAATLDTWFVYIICVSMTFNDEPRCSIQMLLQKLIYFDNLCSFYQVRIPSHYDIMFIQFAAWALGVSCLHLPVKLGPWAAFHRLSPVSTAAPSLWTEEVHRGVTTEEPQPDQVTSAPSVTPEPQPSYVWFNSGHTECSTTCGTGKKTFTKLHIYI